jgi:hypothetical protein
VQRLFEDFQARQSHALAVLDEPTLTRFERAALSTKMLQVLAGYRGRKPRDGDAGRPAIPALSVALMQRRAQDLRDVVGVDGPAAGLTDLQVKHEVATHLDLSWERLRQILTGDLGTGAKRRRAKSDRPAGRPRITDALPQHTAPAAAIVGAAGPDGTGPALAPLAEEDQALTENQAAQEQVVVAEHVDPFRDAMRSR